MRFFGPRAADSLVAALLLVTNCGAGQILTSRRLKPGDLQIAPGLQTVEQPGALNQDAGKDSTLRIVVVEGENAVNLIKKKTAVAPVVEVRNKNDAPVAGAVVTFTTPGAGASALFVNGTRSTTVFTDSAGRASAIGMTPVDAGAFKISVSASFSGLTTTAEIAQTNSATATGASGAHKGMSKGVIALIVGGAAAAGIGAALGGHHSGSSSSTGTTTTSATIGLGSGTPTTGPP